MAKFERKTKEERKTEIMDAAKKVFLSKGYRYATMEDIVAATSLSKGGVYQYYKSTKAIMFDIMQRGNYFRYRRTEEVIASIPETDDIIEIITHAVIAKIFDRLPEKQLYIMFLSEIQYDKETEDLFFTLEEQGWSLAIQNMKSFFEGKKKPAIMESEEFEKQIFPKLYMRILNGILVMYELFSDKNIFEENKQEVYELVYDIIKKSLGQYKYTETT